MPKIVNPRNHQGAATDASGQRFISKLELGSKCTRHSGAGTWTPRWVTAGFLWAGLGDFQKGWRNFFHSDMGERVGEFLKICFPSNTGFSVSVKGILSSVFFLIWDSLLRAILSSVVFLIWDYLPRTLRTFCSFSHKVQLLFTEA